MSFFRLKADEHRWVQDRLSLYLDGRLDPGERARVEAHLRTCVTCARSWETLRWTVQALRALPPVHAPRSFVLRPEQVARAPQPSGWLRRTAWAMAAALILVLGMDLALSLGPTRSEPVRAPAGAPAIQVEQETMPPTASRPESRAAPSTPTPAPMFSLALPSPAPTATTPTPPETPPAAPALRIAPLRALELVLLLGAIGLLALDRWRGQRAH